jgi:hypothetical protein
MRDRRLTYGRSAGFRMRRGQLRVSRWWWNFV